MIRPVITTPRAVDLSLIMRGFFASVVVYWHIDGYLRPIPDWLNIPGRVAVWMFFGISGYVIAYGFLSGRHSFTWPDMANYAIRRCGRILPLFWLLSAVALIIVVSRTGAAPFGLIEGLQEFFALRWVHNNRLVGIFWTLGIELQLYIVAPLIILGIMKVGERWLFLFLGIWAVLIIAFGSLDNRTTPAALPHFLTGMVVARASTSPAIQAMLAKRSVLFLLLLGFGLSLASANFCYHRFPGLFWHYGGAVLVDIAIVCLLLAHCAFERLRISPNPASRALMIVGVLSYGIYAWHGLLLTYFPWFSTALLSTFLASACLAWVSFVLVERPCIEWARRPAAPIAGAPGDERLMPASD